MKKLRTLALLQQALDDDFAWRFKELADVRSALRRPGETNAKILLRAAVPLFYAHWEGFIKNSTTAYVNYVNCQRLRYDELSSCFVAFGARRRLAEFSASSKSTTNIAVVEFLLTGLGARANLSISRVVDTESNLSSRVFENIAKSIGLSTTWYEARYNLIDQSLLKRRNSIAHGNHLELESDDCRKLADDVIALLRSYKTDIENTASTRQYLRLGDRSEA
ncbi:MAG: hypothetical protein DHS20C16_18620 [Phycisphaerae bacterium]|nr:MAG: hypothetical protein DHS20C16_18620 [Phycisphaerae bacterium]